MCARQHRRGVDAPHQCSRVERKAKWLGDSAFLGSSFCFDDQCSRVAKCSFTPRILSSAFHFHADVHNCDTGVDIMYYQLQLPLTKYTLQDDMRAGDSSMTHPLRFPLTRGHCWGAADSVTDIQRFHHQCSSLSSL